MVYTLQLKLQFYNFHIQLNLITVIIITLIIIIITKDIFAKCHATASNLQSVHNPTKMLLQFFGGQMTA